LKNNTGCLPKEFVEDIDEWRAKDGHRIWLVLRCPDFTFSSMNVRPKKWHF
jgi:hypothetical protein